MIFNTFDRMDLNQNVNFMNFRNILSGKTIAKIFMTNQFISKLSLWEFHFFFISTTSNNQKFNDRKWSIKSILLTFFSSLIKTEPYICIDILFIWSIFLVSKNCSSFCFGHKKYLAIEHDVVPFYRHFYRHFFGESC